MCLWTVRCSAGEPLPGRTRLGPGRHALRLTVDGVERTYVVHVPPSYDSTAPSPLVVMLHGGGDTASAAMFETGWTDKADTAGFLAVFPNAMARDPSRRSSFARNPQLWNDGSDRFYPGQIAMDDTRFIDALLDDVLDSLQRGRAAGLRHGVFQRRLDEFSRRGEIVEAHRGDRARRGRVLV